MTALRTVEAVEPPFLSVSALAKRWGVSVSLVRKWVRAGKLAHFKLGERVLVAESDATAFLAASRREATR